MTIDQLTSEFESARASLRSYVFRITVSREDTEDILQDTFIKASEKVDSFRGESSIRTWLFAIASNLAKDHLRARKRWPETVSDICKEKALTDPEYFPAVMQIQQSSPHGLFEVKEHITFCFTCISKSLPLEQQICILLKEVYAFKVAEIATILDTTAAMIKYYLYTGRTKLIRIFEGRCALIQKEGTCHQCSELNGIFNPLQDFEIEKNKIDMAREAEKGDKEHLFDLRMQLMQQIDPFTSAGSDLQMYHYGFNQKVMDDF